MAPLSQEEAQVAGIHSEACGAAVKREHCRRLCWDGVPGFINSSTPLESIRSWVMFSTAQICCALGVRLALDEPCSWRELGSISPHPVRAVHGWGGTAAPLPPQDSPRGMTPNSVPMVVFHGCLRGFVLPPHGKGLGFIVPLLPAGTALARIWVCEWRVNSTQRSTAGFRFNPREHSLQEHSKKPS